MLPSSRCLGSLAQPGRFVRAQLGHPSCPGHPGAGRLHPPLARTSAVGSGTGLCPRPSRCRGWPHAGQCPREQGSGQLRAHQHHASAWPWPPLPPAPGCMAWGTGGPGGGAWWDVAGAAQLPRGAGLMEGMRNARLLAPSTSLLRVSLEIQQQRGVSMATYTGLSVNFCIPKYTLGSPRGPVAPCAPRMAVSSGRAEPGTKAGGC